MVFSVEEKVFFVQNNFLLKGFNNIFFKAVFIEFRTKIIELNLQKSIIIIKKVEIKIRGKNEYFRSKSILKKKL